MVGPLAMAAASLRTAPSGLAASAPAVARLFAPFAGPLLAVAAAIGAALLFELVFDVVKLRRVKRRAAPLGRVAVRGALIGTSRTVSTPTAIGYLHPAVVLPEGFRARVDDGEYDAVVAHECAHLARRDDWAKAVQSAVTRACWWLPGLWVLGRALDLERELASDERAAGEAGPRRYAACLLRLATDRGSELAPAFGGRRSHVAIRVERLLRPVADGGPLVRAIALGAFTAAAFAVVALAMLAVPGTAPHVTSAVSHHAQIVVAHAVVRHAVPRVAARLRRPPAVPHRAPGSVAAARTASARVRVVALLAANAAPEAARATAAAEGAPAHAKVVQAAPQPAVERAQTPVRRTEPRPPVRRAAAIRPELLPVETLAFVPLHRRCRTCFGPLRSPDDAVASQSPSFTPVAGGSIAASAAIADDDTTSGPVSLGAPVIWFRFPGRSLSSP
jgi:beta-lactamase regulating signal transducer with metallopeptidase domain